MRMFCKVFGHQWPQGVQVWAKLEQPEDCGVWMGLRTFCSRCGSTVNAGSLYLQASELRAAITKASTGAPPQSADDQTHER